MFRDTILRQVNQLASAIARALVARKAKDFNEAVLELEEACRQHLSLELDDIIALPPDQLTNLVSVDGVVDADLAVSLANVLEERHNILVDNVGGTDAAFLRTALSLLEIVRDNPGGLVPLGLDTRIDNIKNRMNQ